MQASQSEDKGYLTHCPSKSGMWHAAQLRTLIASWTDTYKQYLTNPRYQDTYPRSSWTIYTFHCIALHLSIVAKKTFYCNDHTITEFGITDKNSSTAYIILYELIDTWFLDSNRRVGVWSLPWRWHIPSIPFTTGRGTSAETCRLEDVFPPDDLGSRPQALC